MVRVMAKCKNPDNCKQSVHMWEISAEPGQTCIIQDYLDYWLGMGGTDIIVYTGQNTVIAQILPDGKTWVACPN